MQRDLVERARRGDHDAFAELAGAAISRLDTAAWLILRDPDQAKDAVQNTLVRPGETCRRYGIPDASMRGCIGCSSTPASMRRAGCAAIASMSSSPRSSRPAVDDAESTIADRDQLERGFLPARARRASAHRPASLPRPAAAGGRGRAGDPARDGEIAPEPSAGPDACGARRRCSQWLGDQGGPTGMTANDRLRPDPLGMAPGGGGASRARPPRRGPRADDRGLASDRPGRASKGGSPWHMTFSGRVVARPRPAWTLLIVLAVLVAIATALAIAGSRQPRVPAPFGLAANGQIAYGADGDILVADPDGTHAHAAISGPSADFAAAYTRDGTQLTFLRGVAQRSDADDRRPGRIGGSAGREGAPDRRYLVRLVAG